MPNHCSNHTYVFGSEDSLRYFSHAIKLGKEDMSIANIVPRPNGSMEDGSWYQWSIDNWGTKWGDYNHRKAIDIDGGLLIRYDTAWGPLGVNFWKRVSENFCGLHFITTFEEGGMQFAGAIIAHNGYVEELSEDYPVGPDDWSDDNAVQEFYDQLDALMHGLYVDGRRLMRL
jgi:hypothetical protein